MTDKLQGLGMFNIVQFYGRSRKIKFRQTYVCSFSVPMGALSLITLIELPAIFFSCELHRCVYSSLFKFYENILNIT